MALSIDQVIVKTGAGLTGFIF